jgi:hypothetical protein
MTCSNGFRLTAWISASVLPMARQLVPCCVLSRGISCSRDRVLAAPQQQLTD